MSLYFNSVEQILTQLEQQPGWETFREYRQLLKCWSQTVNQNIAQHTRPLYIARQILYVATSSAARAQELSFQRYTLLKRLNKQLSFDLKDLRFSSSGWHQKTYDREIQPSLFTISDRQSQQQSKITFGIIKLPPQANNANNNSDNAASDTSSANKAKQAAQRWLKTIEGRSSTICPECNAQTSKEELARWNSCHHCIAQKWAKEYRPATFPETK